MIKTLILAAQRRREILSLVFKYQNSVMKFSVKVHRGTKSICTKLRDEDVFSIAATIIGRSNLSEATSALVQLKM